MVENDIISRCSENAINRLREAFEEVQPMEEEDSNGLPISLKFTPVMGFSICFPSRLPEDVKNDLPDYQV